ncbi:hypothetical protein J3Q64DRAFT_1706300 [Phycomyces blakesleeanus]|uniref:DNA-directed RNA polymerase I, subunit RPA34.5 n=2 Tax=Phycomyces blakesleeanus TaxID=4837 RepID=A0A163EBM7_PHYB8|nr:hypothetical protein PHYBLDRAFT_180004 [Phycomyces blakesleeanus NRRL 1555(-)]OAD77810.1 hypothetical protein PHYBLDRAFT_180004 [Phycomyces blakesleeanus NRRL 1555(-)]|eukprot:XP_018295850.1 hypothetical protein PHYBLDRAFT_180004 [Phycomyces blakesleeanus NRRL 1555(-)]
MSEVKATQNTDFEGFTSSKSKYPTEYDAELLNDDDKEIWLIRVPESFTPKDLTEIKITKPVESSHTSIGKLTKKDETFALYRVPETTEDKAKNSDDEDEEDDEEGKNDFGISGQEMAGFQCLLPSRDHYGKLVYAPKTFKHNLILTREVEIPDSEKIAETIRDTPLGKRQQPEGLKMRFKPYGFDTGAAKVSDEEPEKKKVKKEKKEKK